ncbi:hypothetical protein M153_5187000396 [Pseudoloma neurophilia]|uniref:Uncharacterized protein n=1 Tax=Pseudoloma neurophilia TaxID=146866 RepID=A0A0R0LSS4_9MICR|nr:hypothetical protein M153_5187000396 [Pseudoloma neurophilia]
MEAEIPENIRSLIISKYENDFSNYEIAELFHLKPCTILKIIKNYKESGSFLAKKRGGNHNKILNENHEDFLKFLLQEDATRPLRYLQICLFEEFSVMVSLKTIERTIVGFHFSL